MFIHWEKRCNNGENIHSYYKIIKYFREVNNLGYCQNLVSHVKDNFYQKLGPRDFLLHNQNQQQEQSISSQSERGKKRIVIIAAVILIVLIVLIILSIYFYRLPNEDVPDEEYIVEMIDIGTMEVNIKGKYTGDRAHWLRNLIDTQKGNNDSTVTQNEVDNYLEEFEILSGGIDGTWGLTINDLEGVYSKYVISLTDATGDVNSDSSIFITASITVTWPSIDTNNQSYEIAIWLYTETCDYFKFSSPSGFKIHNVSGLAQVNYKDEKTIVTGSISDSDYPYVVLLSIVRS